MLVTVSQASLTQHGEKWRRSLLKLWRKSSFFRLWQNVWRGFSAEVEWPSFSVFCWGRAAVWEWGVYRCHPGSRIKVFPSTQAGPQHLFSILPETLQKTWEREACDIPKGCGSKTSWAAATIYVQGGDKSWGKLSYHYHLEALILFFSGERACNSVEYCSRAGN